MVVRRILRFAAVVAGVVVLGSGVAFANGENDELRFNYAYDETNYLIVFHSSPLDNGDCVPPLGPAEATYAPFVDGWAAVMGLEPSDGYDLEACPTDAWSVLGPQGQANHGQVVRTFGQAFEGSHKGCLMRWIAGSDFGKDTQQVRTPDVDPTFEPSTTGNLQFMTEELTCHGGHASTAHGVSAAAHGPSGHGNSDSAPGHNKQP